MSGDRQSRPSSRRSTPQYLGKRTCRWRCWFSRLLSFHRLLIKAGPGLGPKGRLAREANSTGNGVRSSSL
jgi:hypothetical protein